MNKNTGFGFANNIGFENAKGKYILLLNPDTVLQEDTLQTMYEFMESNPEVGIAGCKVLNPDGTLQLACRRGIPTPWVAFTKLFGLQTLFPKSKLFGRYNLTFLPEDEFAYVDAISGSFMFLRREVFVQLRGFDSDFFMYGEDLDLCIRAKKIGWKVAYVPFTSIIHYKGQSAKRGEFDSTFHFFKSMEIFTRKHFGKSKIFLFLIKTGIIFRQLLAKVSSYKTEILFVVLDLLFANFSLLLASWIRFGKMFSFPDYVIPDGVHCVKPCRVSVDGFRWGIFRVSAQHLEYLFCSVNFFFCVVFANIFFQRICIQSWSFVANYWFYSCSNKSYENNIQLEQGYLFR